MSQERITLHSPGSIPGIPGDSHGPGTFLVDYEARTIEEMLPDSIPISAEEVIVQEPIIKPETNEGQIGDIEETLPPQ